MKASAAVRAGLLLELAHPRDELALSSSLLREPKRFRRLVIVPVIGLSAALAPRLTAVTRADVELLERLVDTTSRTTLHVVM